MESSEREAEALCRAESFRKQGKEVRHASQIILRKLIEASGIKFTITDLSEYDSVRIRSQGKRFRVSGLVKGGVLTPSVEEIKGKFLEGSPEASKLEKVLHAAIPEMVKRGAQGFHLDAFDHPDVESDDDEETILDKFTGSSVHQKLIDLRKELQAATELLRLHGIGNQGRELGSKELRQMRKLRKDCKRFIKTYNY